MHLDFLVSQLTLDEKANLLTGATSMTTGEVERLQLKAKLFADGPHGVRTKPEDKCIQFPNLCCVGATWDRDLVYEMGQAWAMNASSTGSTCCWPPALTSNAPPCAAAISSIFRKVLSSPANWAPLTSTACSPGA